MRKLAFGRRRCFCRKGSYTIEAALLMSIILPTLICVIYLGFFLHDKGFMQAAAHEAASYASLQADEKGKDTGSVVQKLVDGRMLGTSGVKGSFSMDQKTVRTGYAGNFPVPGMIGALFAGDGIAVRADVSLSLQRPSKRIQTIRGIRKVIDHIRDY